MAFLVHMMNLFKIILYIDWKRKLFELLGLALSQLCCQICSDSLLIQLLTLHLYYDLMPTFSPSLVRSQSEMYRTMSEKHSRTQQHLQRLYGLLHKSANLLFYRTGRHNCLQVLRKS